MHELIPEGLGGVLNKKERKIHSQRKNQPWKIH
jgi:hypothetical protein